MIRSGEVDRRSRKLSERVYDAREGKEQGEGEKGKCESLLT